MRRARMSFVVAMLVAFAAATAYGQSITTIDASPLKINVGADGSFQIFNTAVPGVGQVFPTGGSLADMGLMAHIDGALYAPSFTTHTGGTATGNLGAYTPWTQLGIPRLTGNGTQESPYTVAIALAAPGTDVRVTMTVRYVRGNNFFRVSSNFFSTTNTLHEIDATFGADIFLAASDAGIFVSVPELGAVGGRDCGDGGYNILLIPITPASRFTASFFSHVWQQIAANELNNTATPGACQDNGAAIQWRNIMQGPATSVELSHAVSFGAIPSAANFHPFSISVTPDFVTMAPGESQTLTVTSVHNPEFDFNSPVRLTAPALPQGMTITFDKAEIPAPGNGTAKATLSIDNTIFPQRYEGLAILGSGGNEVRFANFGVDVLCTPPTILGTSQPVSQTVASGAKAKLRVTAQGGAGTYQWYSGHAPITRFPVAGATSAEFETPAIFGPEMFWVRVSNPCGTVDSLTATVSPQ